MPRAFLSLRPVQALAVQRHEAGRERAFAEQAAEGVGQAEGDEEGVGLPLAPITRLISISRAKPAIRLTSVSPPIVPVALIRFIPARSGSAGSVSARPVGSAARSAPGSARRRRSCLLGLGLQPAPCRRAEIDRVEQQRREAGVLRPPRR